MLWRVRVTDGELGEKPHVKNCIWPPWGYWLTQVPSYPRPGTAGSCRSEILPKKMPVVSRRDLHGSRILMSERSPLREVETPQPVPAQERRGKRRVGVSLQLRIRPLEFSDGNFEEVRTTLNVSRNALYFFTKLDRYYSTMRLRITSAYGPFVGSGSWEDTGEVVRVHRRGDGFGVAVLLSPSSNLALPGPHAQVTRPGNARDADRRGDLRCSFVVPAELIDIRAGVSIQARTSDLSLNGCYIDTLNPFPLGTSVRLRIYKGNELFEVPANVSSRHPGSGMGLVFRDIAPAYRSTLECWLCESLAATKPSPMTLPRVEKTAQPEARDDSRTIRLIRMLVRKGVLTQSEGVELLRDPDS